MSLIPTEPVLPKKEQLAFRFDPEVLHLLESCCQFILSTQHYVLEQALLLVFRRDREFQSWLKSNATTRKEQKAKLSGGAAEGESSDSGA